MSRGGRLAGTAVIAGMVACGALTAPAARAQTERWRMIQSTDIGWAARTGDVTCTETRGFVHRKSHTMTWYLNPAGQGAGKETAIQRALGIWSAPVDPGTGQRIPSDFVLNWGGTKSSGYKQGDGLNMMVWSTATDSGCQGICHAITALLLEPGQVIKEADIQFNDSSATAFQWMTNGEWSDLCWEVVDPATGTIRTGLKLDTTGIATHELGHAVGIYHPENYKTTSAVMGNRACTSVPDNQRLKADDLAALRCAENRYPDSPSYQGGFEQATCQTVSGWAWNANKSYQNSYVEIYETSTSDPPAFLKVHAVTKADVSRPDLAAQGIGDGRHGFSYSFPATSPLRDARWHRIRARYSGTFADLGGSKDLICNVFLFPETMSPADPPLSTGGLEYEVATQFQSSQPGYITQIGYRFAPGEENAGPHTVRLWADTGGPPLASAFLFPQHGWSYASIGRVKIQPNVRYRASVNTYAYQSKSSCGTSTSLSSPYTSGPLTAIQGFWRQGSGVFPNTSSCSNFFVNVVFDM